jgi:mono/diheme cytochrome c family protein
MNKLAFRLVLPVFILLIALVLVTTPAAAKPAQQDGEGDPERGDYLVSIIGCLDCHTPLNPETGQPVPDMIGAGGQEFPLPNLPVVVSKNITSDEATGLGGWTDEEIKVAITTGVSRDGLHLFPIMPYAIFNRMSEQDLNDIVAYLRTLPPINNVVERQQILPVEALPAIPRVDPPATAPDPSDTAARGEYLMTALLTCGDCHTPLDPNTLSPVADMKLAGGQPFEGPWGIVYGGNITPHEETGIGTWTDEEIERVMRLGIRPDGRQVILMPWQVYRNLSDDDMKAVINYLRNDLPAVDNEVPASVIEPAFVNIVPIATEEASAPPAAAGGLSLPILAGVFVAILALVVVFVMRRRSTPAG